MSRSSRVGVLLALGSVVLLVLPGCGPRAEDITPAPAGGGSVGSSPSDVAMVAPARYSDPVGGRSIALKGGLLSADVLVVSERAIPSNLVSRVRGAQGVRLARMDAVWSAVARGDALLSHQVGRELHETLGDTLRVGSERNAVPLRVGAYATTVSRIDAVVNDRRRDQLGMQPRIALLVSVDDAESGEALAAIREVVGERAQVQPIGSPACMSETRQAGFLTGGALARAVGAFSYRALPDGSVRPELGWVAANIRIEQVPILGRVTCHRVMLPQLRKALSEVVERGLAGAIDVGSYGGCYVPRFIGHDPSRGLSLHTWGIALDLNVPGNQRGTVGQIDRRVVGIFKRWGFAWGGDWQWTDPMHFELAALVRVGGRS